MLETFTLGNLLTIGGILIVIGGGWYKLGGIRENREALSEHKRDKDPHKACPAHEAIIKAMQADLSGIRQKIIVMDQRIYDIWKNGIKK